MLLTLIIIFSFQGDVILNNPLHIVLIAIPLIIQTFLTKGIPPKDGEGNGMLSKMENGIRYFSTDGGMTWSQAVPEGVTVREEDGRLTIINGVTPKDG